MKHSDEILRFFEINFNEKKCHELSRESGFIQRSTSKLDGYEFIQTMILPSEGLSTDSLKGLCKRIRELNPEAELSSQALCQRINDASSGKLMKRIASEILLKVHESLMQNSPYLAEGLEQFNRTILQDSTVVTLNEKLAHAYPGASRGNNCVKSQVKIDLIWDIGKGCLIDAGIYGGRDPDQSLTDRILHYLKPGDLVVRDLGYFAILTFKAIAVSNAYFLSRLKARVGFYLNKEDKTALDLSEYLKKHTHLNIIELKGYIGTEKMEVRMVIYRQSKEVTDKRLREANKNSRKKGETMSKSKKLLLSFAIFITNAPEDMLSTNSIGTIYRLRWEIELVFKRWKNQLEIDYLKGIHEERIECLIWSRLCTVIIVDLIIGIFNTIAKKLNKTELSSVKLIQYLMRGNAFCKAVSKNQLELFFEEMEKDIVRMLLKDSRARKTMRERVRDGESYYGIQTLVNEHSA